MARDADRKARGCWSGIASYLSSPEPAAHTRLVSLESSEFFEGLFEIGVGGDETEDGQEIFGTQVAGKSGDIVAVGIKEDGGGGTGSTQTHGQFSGR